MQRQKVRYLADSTIAFLWQHLLLIVSMFFMTLGVALCVRSNLGSGVISSIPMALTLAGEVGKAPSLTIGGYTNIMNVILVVAQILVLRRQFEKVQLFQLVVGFIFGAMLDINMWLTSYFSYDAIFNQFVAQLAGATILGVAVAAEIRCGSVTMPGEGIQVAISRFTGNPFPIVKICVDTTLVIIAVICGFIFFGKWPWTVVGPGTLFAMFYVGYVVRLVNPHMKWVDCLMGYHMGLRRHIYGLARFIYPKAFSLLVPLVLCSTVAVSLSSCSSDEVLSPDDRKALELTMDNAREYEKNSEQHIASMKDDLRKTQAGTDEEWQINLKLSRAYRVINADSALSYAWNARRLADKSGDSVKIIRSSASLVGAMSTAGFFFACRETLDSIFANMPDDPRLKVEVWSAARLFYSYSKSYADGTPEYEDTFNRLYIACDDSLIKNLPADSHFKTFLNGEHLVTAGKTKEAREALLPLMDSLGDHENLYGMAAYQVARSYMAEGDIKGYTSYLSKAAISDIKANTKEGIALPELAGYLYSTGGKNDTERAFKYINFALNGASGGKVRMRTATLGSSITMIDTAYNQGVRTQHRLFFWSLLVFFLLLVALVVLVFVLYNQVKRRRLNEEKLARTASLQESYIGNFIGLCSNYAERMEDLSKLVARKLGAGQGADLLKMIESGKFSDENEEFYKVFDHAILDIYPDFIGEINKLLKPEEQLEIKGHGRLNAELRIYALIRMGVTESTRIAQILRYSVNTVYVYRNRMRNRALNRVKFEAEVMGKRADQIP